MISLIALLLACGSPDAASTQPASPDATDPVTQPGPDGTVPVTTDDGEIVPDMPRGLRTLPPADVAVRVDALSARCDGSDAHVIAETVGPADDVQVDLLAADGRVDTVTMAAAPRDAATVWHRFDGDVACDRLEGATWVVRARRSGAEVDCTVHGAEAVDALGGSWDDALATAGRPSLEDCRPI